MCAYCDANWVGNMDGRKSTSSYVFLLRNGVISWNSKKQTFIIMSSIKAKYMVTSQVRRQVMWFYHFLEALVFHK
jgi:hypothetical protein